jgi:hypothetical protein
MKQNGSKDIWSIISAIGGSILVIGVVIFMVFYMQALELRADHVYKSEAMVELELQGLEREMLAIESVIRASEEAQAEGVEVAGIIYSQGEIQHLKNEVMNYKDMIKVKRETADSVYLSKESVYIDLVILFWVGLAALLIGLISAVLGYLSWFHKLRIFRDRRNGPRADDLKVFNQDPGA